ncbi:conjugal transfer protein TraW [Sphingobium sp. LB126]|nr:conjugal transfer protein TraW [Sphingobium sp. LB126]
MFLAVGIGTALLAVAANAATTTIGRTWPIAEPDALSEIEGRATRVPDMRQAYGPRSGWSAMKAAALGDAREDRQRTVVPFFTLDQEIKLPDGRVVYPKGFTFNPLAFVKLPQRLVVARPADLPWALRTARASDFILMAAGKPGDADAITLSERHGRSIFILEERVKQRLGLTVAPVVVVQSGQKLVLTEVGPTSRLPVKGAAK